MKKIKGKTAVPVGSSRTNGIWKGRRVYYISDKGTYRYFAGNVELVFVEGHYKTMYINGRRETYPVGPHFRRK